MAKARKHFDFDEIEEYLRNKTCPSRPFQERRAIARTRAHTRAKVFRRVVNHTRK